MGGYAQYGAIFDRHLPWEEKLAAMEKRTRRQFIDWKGGDKKLLGDKRKK